MDGSFLNYNIEGNAGWVLQDDNGHYKGSTQAVGRKVQNAFESELQAYRRIQLEEHRQNAFDILNNIIYN